MQFKQLSLVAAISALTFTTTTNAVLGPIPIYLNTEYRTDSPVIGSIASTIILNKDQIKASGANTFTELLATIQGVAFEGGAGNLTSLRIRGNKPSHTLLLVDGSKVSITASQPNFDVVPLDQIERVEISKGPFSSLYGPGAIGGVVHVFTNRETNEGESTTLSASYGTHNSRKTSISSSINNNGNYIDYSLSKYTTDGIDSRYDNNEAFSDTDLDSIDRTSGSLNVGYILSEDNNVKLNILKTDATLNYDKGSAFDILKPDNNLFQYNFELNQTISGTHKIKLDYAKQKTQRRTDKYELITKSLINEFNTTNNKVTLGFVDVIDKDIDNSAQIKHTDIFSQWQGIVADNEFSIGARIVDHDKFKKHNTFNLSWAKPVNSTTRLTVSHGKATNLPSHYQNKLNVLNGYGDVKPEQAISSEIGTEILTNFGIINAKIYNTKVSNAFKYNDPDGPLDFTDVDGDGYDDNAYYGNGGITQIHGFEIATNTLYLDWNIDMAYDYNKTIDKTSGSNSLNFQKGRVPHHTASITATKEQGKYSHRINLTGKSWTWDKDDHSTGKLGGYGLLNLSTNYAYNNKATVSVKLNNALDKKYTVAKPYNTLGRTVTLGITQKF